MNTCSPVSVGEIPTDCGKKAFDRNLASYLFAAVRSDLSAVQQGVQLCHATALAAANGGLDPDTRFVLVSVKNKDELLLLAASLAEDGIAFDLFEEPDYQIGPSALATHKIKFKSGKRFSRLPLWSP